jgi:hypothetical protein
MRPVEARNRLAVTHDLLERSAFWNALSDGLAVFISADGWEAYRLPLTVDDQVVVGDRLYVKPLLPLVAVDGRYLLLALSENAVRLFEGDRTGLRPVESVALPKNMEEALNYDEPNVARQWHNARPGTHQSRDVVRHGQGGKADQQKPELHAYCQALQRRLQPFLAQEHAPLVLACVDFVRPIFTQECPYAHLVQEHVSGNPDLLDARQLHERAWPLVEAIFREPVREALQRYPERAHTGLGVHELEQVLTAAADGAIATLLVDCTRSRWGMFDRSQGVYRLREQQASGDEELIDLAIALTLRNRGEVYPVAVEELPEGSPLAAILRYPRPLAGNRQEPAEAASKR